MFVYILNLTGVLYGTRLKFVKGSALNDQYDRPVDRFGLTIRIQNGSKKGYLLVNRIHLATLI